MGSRLSVERAYIAGFLDGDGSLMLQLKKRRDSTTGIRFMATLCLYQDTRHEKPLLWIRRTFRIGYISRRNDGITELRINGYASVHSILLQLRPYIRFKKKQTEALLKACEILGKAKISRLSKQRLKRLVDLMLIIQNENYSAKRKRTKEELYTLLNLTP